ncbi:MAG: pilin [Gammaproteobacteria bacterium]
MKNNQTAFTLIELMIAVAIIGILAAIAIPSYQQFVGRAQVGEALSLMASKKHPLVAWYTDEGGWPASLVSLEGGITGRYVSSIAGIANLETYTITATMKTYGVTKGVASRTLQLLTLDGGKTWRCQSGGATPVDHLFMPGSCR